MAQHSIPAFFFLKIAQNNNCGLCNQLYALTGCIDHSNFYKKYNVLIIDKFLRGIETESYCPISEIVDLKKFNVFLQKYNVYLIDSYYIQLEIIDIFEEKEKKEEKEDNKDITRDILIKYFKYNCLEIPKDIIHNRLIINYRLNKETPIFTKIFEKGEKITLDFTTNNNIFNRSPQLYLGGSEQRNVFFNILSNIPFQKKFVTHAFGILENIIKNNNNSSDFNVIHMRLERDAIEVESKNANIAPNIFKNKMEEKYIETIKKYVNKDVLNIILSPNFDNRVIEFLKENNYKFIVTEKNFLREENAIIDLLIGFFCTKTFIGVYESSFSYTLLHKIILQIKPKGFKGVLFEMHRPHIEDQIFTI